MAASVRVSIPEGGGRFAGGSGAIIGVSTDGKIGLGITAKHVFRAGTGYIYFPDGTKKDIWFHKSLAKGDLTLFVFWCDADKTPWVPVADTDVEKGESVYQVGYPRSKGPFRRLGKALGYNSFSHGGVPNLAVNFETVSGDSGSPVFRTKDESLVGVIWGGSNGTGEATGWRTIRAFVDETCGDETCWILRRRRQPKPDEPVEPIKPIEGKQGPKGDKGDPGQPGKNADSSEVLLLKTELEKLRAELDKIKKDVAAGNDKRNPTPAFFDIIRKK